MLGSLAAVLWRQSSNRRPDHPGERGATHRRRGDAAQLFFPESLGPDLAKGLWLPLQPTPEMLKVRGYHLFFILGQRKPGASLGQLRAELAAITQHIRQADPKITNDIS